MGIKIIDCHLEGNNIGIKAPTSAEIEMTGTTFRNNGKAIDIFVSPTDLESLGLPANTPQEYILEVLQILNEKKEISEEKQIESISDSQLFKWLGHSSSIVTIGSALISFFKTL